LVSDLCQCLDSTNVVVLLSMVATLLYRRDLLITWLHDRDWINAFNWKPRVRSPQSTSEH